jgi:hypothetical protein
LETACGVIESGPASSLSVASPAASRLRIARRTGSASAANVLLSSASPMFNPLVYQPTG